MVSAFQRELGGERAEDGFPDTCPVEEAVTKRGKMCLSLPSWRKGVGLYVLWSFLDE